MKIGLVGSSGYISGFIKERFKDEKIIKIDKTGDVDYELDLEKAADFDYEVLNGIEQIIFPAAISSPDLCEKEYDLCWRINVEGTKTFIRNALERKCRVLFFSSDAVFGDHPDQVFDENSPTKTNTAYGKMKKAIEDEFKDNRLFKVIRLSYVVSPKDKFTRYVLSCLKSGEICEVYDPFERNCIIVSDVLDCIDYLIHNWDKYEPVFLNIAGKDLISREDIVKELNLLFDNRIKYKVVYPGEAFYSCRPKVCCMKSIYLNEYGILKNESFHEKMIREFSDR